MHPDINPRLPVLTKPPICNKLANIEGRHPAVSRK
jgi:hypothetical protein